MRSAYQQPVWDRRRIIAVAATLVAHLLVALLLIELAPTVDAPPLARETTSFALLPDAGEATPTRQRTTRRQVRAAARPTAAAAPRRTPPTVAKGNQAAEWPSEIMQLGLAGNDIGRIKGTATAAEATTGTESADSSGAQGAGEGPGGQRLYDADWYRRPRQSELDFYQHRSAPPGAWATIACRTVERYHVEDCRILDESPVGSGLARGVRDAAWQFLVRPPRVGGRSLVGSWVRIRIGFTDKPDK